MNGTRSRNSAAPVITKMNPNQFVLDRQYQRSYSQINGKRKFRYFSLESMVLLVCLTASLLVLPLVLPPLPPPPSMLLILLPIGILTVLVILAFLPSDHVRETRNNNSSSYM